ncbi:MAG: endonuclease domain-containing protein [Lysobacter sp.]|nr:endonuclease domain-containing protein [Lysobacter sp.]
MEGQTSQSIHRNKLQRGLRKRMTDAEQALWRILRGRQLDGCKFRRQYPHENYILDFVCLEHRMVIEVDCGQHAESASDEARDVALAAAGFMVLRFWNHDVLADSHAVGDEILRRLQDTKTTHPHPDPPLEGKGDKLGHLHPLASSRGGNSMSGT